MCVVSAVYDYYHPIFDDYGKVTPNNTGINIPTMPIGITPATSSFIIISQEEVAAIRSLIKEFREAVVAAKVVDKLTNQPDCEDPEKKKLEDRVAELEARLSMLEHKQNGE